MILQKITTVLPKHYLKMSKFVLEICLVFLFHGDYKSNALQCIAFPSHDSFFSMVYAAMHEITWLYPSFI
jgi:hypothetical protein